MTLRQYLLVMTIAAALCWTAWFLAISTTDPNASGVLAFVFFYTTLFLALMGTFTVIGFAVRVWILRQDELIFRNVRKTFRQGVLFATLLCGSLVLKRAGLFNMWIAALFILLLSCIEFFFISYVHTRK